MDFNTGLKQMGDNIELYEKREIGLHRLKENLFGLYELVDGRSNDEFADRFHESWDFLEEICAVNGELEYQKKIDSEIVPAFKTLLGEWLDRM